MQTPFGEIDLSAIFNEETLRAIAEAAIVFVVSFLVLRLFVFLLRRVLRRRSPNQLAVAIPRIVNYVGLAIIVSVILVQAGVNLAPVLGAAGVVGLAVGIASQASLSNMISGFLLASEKTFVVGDVIRIGTTTGIVDSIDLLSTKIRTFDNLYVRVPNETVASSEITNITRFPIRRLDIKFTVPFDTDLPPVFALLRELAVAHRLVLEEPEPLVLPLDYTEIGCRVLFGVWFSKTDFLTVKSEMFAAISQSFAERGLRFAVPPRAVINGDQPLAVDLRSDSGPEGAPQG